MLLNSLLFAILLSDAVVEPRLRGTSTSDVNEGASENSKNCPDKWTEVEEFCCIRYFKPWPNEWEDCYEWDEVAIMTAPVQPPPNATSEIDSP